jgi:hypothetical protein
LDCCKTWKHFEDFHRKYHVIKAELDRFKEKKKAKIILIFLSETSDPDPDPDPDPDSNPDPDLDLLQLFHPSRKVSDPNPDPKHWLPVYGSPLVLSQGVF